MKSIYQSILEHPFAEKRENHYYRWYPKSLSKFRNPLPPFYSEVDGLYIHVPFCDKLCSFCPYIKGLANEDEIELYIQALLKEMELYREFISSKSLSFVYFGGGTPSVLSERQISLVLKQADKFWMVNEKTEVSLETHPTHATLAGLQSFKRSGVNRISIGIQSFDKNNLIRLGAAHNQIDSRLAVETANQVFDNFAVDLIYAYSDQKDLSWEADLDFCMKAVRVPHLSCYPIVPVSSKITTIPLGKEIEMALYAVERGMENGMERYASCASGGFDLAMPGRICVYEKEHWGAPQARFLGLGPSAFGYLGKYTTVNTTRNRQYLSDLLDRNQLPLVSFHKVSNLEQMHRYFSLGVKTYNVPFRPYIDRFQEHPKSLFCEHFAILQESGLANITTDDLRLTEIGKLYVDDCSSIFFSKSEASIPHPEEFEIAILQKNV